MKKKIYPWHDYIAVRPAPEETQKFGFEVAQSAQTRPKRGEVVAVGPGVYAKQTGVLIPMRAQVGDIVLYGKFSGAEIEDDGEILYLMREDEVLGTVYEVDDVEIEGSIQDSNFPF